MCAAEFVDDARGLQVVAMLDLPLSVYAGACIGLMPPGGAQDMVRERDCPPVVVDNLYEVLNIMTSLFNTSGNPHLRIGPLHAPGTVLPAEVARAASQPGERIDLAVEIAAYGEGRLALVTA